MIFNEKISPVFLCRRMRLSRYLSSFASCVCRESNGCSSNYAIVSDIDFFDDANTSD